MTLKIHGHDQLQPTVGEQFNVYKVRVRLTANSHSVPLLFQALAWYFTRWSSAYSLEWSLSKSTWGAPIWIIDLLRRYTIL